MISLHRICWRLLDPLKLLDDEGRSWDVKFYSASWIAHIVKLGVRRQIDRDALATLQGAGTTRTGPIAWQPISEALHGKRLTPHQRRTLRGVITGCHWLQVGELAKAGASFHAASEAQEKLVRGATRLHNMLLLYIAQFEVWFHQQGDEFKDCLFPDPEEDGLATPQQQAAAMEPLLPWPWLVQKHALLEYPVVGHDRSLIFCTSCCKYSDTGSLNHRGLDKVCCGREGGSGRIAENTRHFSKLRHPQSLHKDIALLDARRPTARVRTLVCKSKGWRDPLMDAPEVVFRPKGRVRAEPQRYLGTSLILKDYGLFYPEALELGAPRESDSDDDVDTDMV
ncbi:unnamed protein product [Prorocentrum cordatum]|uniref:Uncharacterized protein n=1 Tax=Prorocentrum cordatum TaxID=2364126 RepID=A0ABN9XH17_9DINO|nr:unnamed protein product [Polarella glacialis]